MDLLCVCNLLHAAQGVVGSAPPAPASHKPQPRQDPDPASHRRFELSLSTTRTGFAMFADVVVASMVARRVSNDAIRRPHSNLPSLLSVVCLQDVSLFLSPTPPPPDSYLRDKWFVFVLESTFTFTAKVTSRVAVSRS